MKFHPSWENKPAEVRFSLSAKSTTKDIRESAFLVLDRLQHLPADRQMFAVFAAAVIMANAVGKDAHDLVVQTRKMVTEAGLGESSADAISDYAKGELA